MLYHKETCHLQLKKCRFIRLSSRFYYKLGQWWANFITLVRVHKPSSCPTDYTFCFHTGSYIPFSYRFLVHNVPHGIMLEQNVDCQQLFLTRVALSLALGKEFPVINVINVINAIVRGSFRYYIPENSGWFIAWWLERAASSTGAVSSNPEACTWSRRPNFVRKGGLLVVERVLRLYRWPRHCWALNPQKQPTICLKISLLNLDCKFKDKSLLGINQGVLDKIRGVDTDFHPWILQ